MLLNFKDMPGFVVDMETILEGAGYINEFDEVVSEREVWEYARQYEDIPIFESIYLDLLFSKFASLAEEKGLICDYLGDCLYPYFNFVFEEDNIRFEGKNDYYEALKVLGIDNSRSHQ